MEIDAVVALNSLDAAVHRRSSPDHQIQCGIKLTEGTLSRLVHLLQSGCSIQLACDEVPPATHCPPPPSAPPLPLTFVPFQIGVSRTSFYRWADRARTQDAPYIYYECAPVASHSRPRAFEITITQVCSCAVSNTRSSIGAVFGVHCHTRVFPVSRPPRSALHFHAASLLFTSLQVNSRSCTTAVNRCFECRPATRSCS